MPMRSPARSDRRWRVHLERRDNALIVIAPADYSFNPKRHTMLMPITLNPLGKVAKMAQADPQSGIRYSAIPTAPAARRSTTS